MADGAAPLVLTTTDHNDHDILYPVPNPRQRIRLGLPPQQTRFSTQTLPSPPSNRGPLNPPTAHVSA